MIPRIVLAAPASGSGKTTVTLGIMAALRRRGLRVAPFKVGPDYIDPQFHRVAAVRESYNLDRFFLGEEGIRRTFAHGVAGAEIAIIEGVMGLFDGLSPESNDGSTADVAAILGAPVVLVVDAAGMGRSLAALLQGFRTFDPRIEIAGVILNGLKTERHLEYLRSALDAEKIPILGCLIRDADLSLPERHLGLVPPPEHAALDRLIDSIASAVEKTIDLERLIELASGVNAIRSVAPRPSVPIPLRPIRIGWAEDEAFSFSYRENKDLLEEAGAEIVTFSPLKDAAFPEDLDALWIGGGYPEIFVEELSRNRTMIEAIRSFADRGKVIHAECGGLMYLCEWFEKADGERVPLVRLIPGGTRLSDKLQSFGYAEATLLRDLPFGLAGTKIRGHRFHYSEYMAVEELLPAAYSLHRPSGKECGTEGLVRGNVIASYLHIHLGSRPESARYFVDCIARR
jgi:cobyrinic acid a,c-diamide synthase